MTKEKKFHAEKFHTLMNRKIKAKGYRSVSQFLTNNNLKRNALARAMAGMTRPTVASLNLWCKTLECTPEERSEIIASVYVDEDAFVVAA